MGPSKWKTRLFFRACVVAGALVAGVATFAACSNQAEGERCDQAASNNGNDDCQDGLICYSKNDLASGFDGCCPPDRTKATTAVCAVKHAPVGGDAAPPPADTGAGDGNPEAAAPDSSSDTGTTDTGMPETGGDAGAG